MNISILMNTLFESNMDMEQPDMLMQNLKGEYVKERQNILDWSVDYEEMTGRGYFMRYEIKTDRSQEAQYLVIDLTIKLNFSFSSVIYYPGPFQQPKYLASYDFAYPFTSDEVTPDIEEDLRENWSLNIPEEFIKEILGKITGYFDSVDTS